MSSVAVARSTTEVLDLQKWKTRMISISLILEMVPITSILLVLIHDREDILFHAMEAIRKLPTYNRLWSLFQKKKSCLGLIVAKWKEILLDISRGS